MAYQSLTFLLFSAAALLIYYLVGRKRQKHVMVLASLAFYALAGLRYLPFLLSALLICFFAGQKIGRIWEEEAERLKSCESAEEKKSLRSETKKRARRWLLTGMILLLTALVWCKYASFLTENLNALLARISAAPLPLFSTILPLGISFYTFMTISYLLDVYWKRCPAERDLISFAAYLTWFPHITQGPIDRYGSFRETVASGVDFDTKNLSSGAMLTVWGFFKKLVIADRLNLFVNGVFDSWQEHTGVIFLLAAFIYSVQIYADFSGCIDIVSGISEMFGIRLTKNFNHPYFARTMPEFWRRWHMSLMEWFKDYVFFPVSTSTLVKNVKRLSKQRGHKRAGELFASCFPALVVWLITGFWHGAAWKYVAWGLYHAMLIITGNIFGSTLERLTGRLKIPTESYAWKAWQRIRTFFLCSVGRIFFRASGISAAFGIFRRSFRGANLPAVFSARIFEIGLAPPDAIVAVLAVLVLWAADWLDERRPLRLRLTAWRPVARLALAYALVFAVLIFGIYGPGYDASTFIYMKF